MKSNPLLWSSFFIAIFVISFIASYRLKKRPDSAISKRLTNFFTLSRIGKAFYFYGYFFIIFDGLGVVLALLGWWGSARGTFTADATQILLLSSLRRFARAWYYLLVGICLRKAEKWGQNFCIAAIVVSFLDTSFIIFSGLPALKSLGVLALSLGLLGYCYYLLSRPQARAQFKGGSAQIPFSMVTSLGIVAAIWLGVAYPLGRQMAESHSQEIQRSAERRAVVPGEPVLNLALDGTLRDSGPYHFPVKAIGNEIRFADGVHNQAVFIGGSEDWIEARIDEPVSLAKGATLELWFGRADWKNTYKGWVQTLATLNGVFGLELREEESTWQLAGWIRRDNTISKAKSAPGSVPPGVWIHAALVYEPLSRILKLYMNGAQVSEEKDVPMEERWFARSLQIGTWHRAAQAYRGYIDEVKLYDYARSPEQIREDAAR